jgi:sugar diacid utilization regulator
MSAIAQARVDVPVMKRTGDREQGAYRAAVAAFSELSAAPGTGQLDDLLRLIAARACEVLRIKRCGVYLRDDPREVFVGCAAHPREEIEQAVRRLTLGGPTDEITRELVRAGAPLVIRDTDSDPRAARAAIRAWKLRSLLAVPMLAGGEVIGLMIFDNACELHPYTPADVEIATAIASLAAGTVVQSQLAEQLKAKLETATRQNLLLRRTATAEHRLSDALLRGGGLSAVVELVAELTGKPAALYDAHGRPVAKAGAAEDGGLEVRLLEEARNDADIARVLRDVVAGSCASVGPLLAAGIRHRHIAAPVDVGGSRWGWLIVIEHPSRLSAFDEFLTRRAATHLALELAGRRQLNASTSDARASFARQLLRGTQDRDELRRTAEYLGIALEVPRVVAYLTRRHLERDATFDIEPLVAELRERLNGDVLATKGPEGVALVIDVPSSTLVRPALRRVKLALADACSPLANGTQLIAGLSSLCRDSSSLPSAYREAREVSGCIERFAGISSRTIVAADDLGPGRLFLANINSDSATRFVEDLIGPLLTGDEAADDLLRTLEAFYDTGRSVRLSSERLGVHENTIRYRLARVRSITGLDVAADAEDQLSVQVSLLVLRLQGHSALRPFEAEAVPVEPGLGKVVVDVRARPGLSAPTAVRSTARRRRPAA